MEPIASFSIDLALILRLFGALAWGAAYAIFLQLHPLGKFLVRFRTWVTVVIGVGVDLGIAYPGDWWTVAAVIAVSSVGIIARSLFNEEKTQRGKRMPDKTLYSIMDAIALSKGLIERLEKLIKKGGKDTQDLEIAAIVTIAYQIKEKCQHAQAGEYEEKLY